VRAGSAKWKAAADVWKSKTSLMVLVASKVRYRSNLSAARHLGRASGIGASRPLPRVAVAAKVPCVNAGEKMHRRTGVKLHHGWMPQAATRGLLLRGNRLRSVLLTGECSGDVERCLTKRAAVASIDPAAGPSSPSESYINAY
jgi:hypothetical protein